MKLLTHIKDRLSGKIPKGAKRSDKWPSVRKAHLQKYPRCQGCGETEKLQVHHKKPFHLHPELELDPSNLITLCEAPGRDCHLHLGHLLSFKSFNPEVENDTKAWYNKVLGRPKTGE
jgi:5-methylcytosine-specific restriction enzyme A